MANSSLQDIICCIGHPVSGNPTQYVMERALAAAALDIRCLTFDVAPEQLPAAIGGVRAMGFLGAVIASPHEPAMSDYVSELRVTGSANFVDLIYREEATESNHGLVGEATIGAAIVKLVAQRLEPQCPTDAAESDSPIPATLPASALVLGEDAKAQAIADSLAAAQIVTTLVCSAAPAPDSNPRQEETSEASDSLPPDEGSTNDSDTSAAVSLADEKVSTLVADATDPAMVPVRRITFEEMKIGNVTAEFVVSAVSELPSLPELSNSKVVLDLAANSGRTEFLTVAAAANCMALKGVDVELQRLMIAYQRWTGTLPDEQVMREALEEYLLV